MAPDWARHTAKLPPPDGSGSAVYVLGSAHISASSADEAAELIRAVRPSAVVVELDPVRYERLLAAQRLGRVGSGAEVASRGGSALKLAQLAYRGELPGFALSLAYAAGGALFGSEPGAEFAAAVAAAHEVGATQTSQSRACALACAPRATRPLRHRLATALVVTRRHAAKTTCSSRCAAPAAHTLTPRCWPRGACFARRWLTAAPRGPMTWRQCARALSPLWSACGTMSCAEQRRRCLQSAASLQRCRQRRIAATFHRWL